MTSGPCGPCWIASAATTAVWTLLVNDIFGGDRYAQWDKPLWQHDLTGGLQMLRMGIETHVITNAVALPLVLESGARDSSWR